MDLSSLSLFNVMKKKMNWSAQRNDVIAQNLANADTPGYAAKDIEAFDFKQALRDRHRMGPDVTHVGHMPGNSGGGPSFRTETERQPYEVSPTGNSVVLEQQMMMMGQNKAEYDMVLNLYRKTTTMMRTALGNQ